MGRSDARHDGRRRSFSRLLFLWLPVALVLVVLAGAFVSFEYDLGDRLGLSDDDTSPAAVEPPAGLELPELPTPEPVAGALAGGTVREARIRAALAPYVRDKDLGPHVGVAVAQPGQDPVYEKGQGVVTPASTMKLLTTTAALESLGPDARFTTRVVDGARPRDIVLVGGGDPYLARKPGGRSSYPKVADVTTLAGKTAAALKADGRTAVRVQYDDHLFTGPKASPTWPATYADVAAPMSALWVDQGTTPGQYGFDEDPAASAADAFATALRAAGIKVTGTPKRVKAGESADLASVESPPLWQLVERVLAISDNEGADVLSHQVGLAEGFGGSFEGGARGVRKVLNGLDVDLAGAVIHDGSGLSRRDRLRPETLLDVLTHAADADRPELRAVITGLPVAGFSGSLAFRFDKGPPAGRGRVRAKTGTLTGVHGLAGVTTDKQGNLMSFVLIADRVKLEDTLDARATLDHMAAALGACRCG